MKRKILSALALFLILTLSLSSCLDTLFNFGGGRSYLLDEVPDFDGKTAYVTINEGKPFFTEEEITDVSFESYSELDSLGRCGPATACVGKDIMPTEERGSIGQVKPSGWHTVKYDVVDGKYLYNRCHLIGYQLTGENANKKNLITGTRFLNIEGMLDFENMIADYVKETGNHVMYRVTPIFKDSNLVAHGVLLEAYSVEDSGAGVEFCVYSYNAQPKITIDYLTGKSALNGEDPSDSDDENALPDDNSENETVYMLNTNSKKFHSEDCSYADSIAEKNKKTYYGTREELIEDGYTPCGTCKP